MAYRNGTYIAFDGNDTTDPTRSDMKYYGLLQAWNKDRNNTLSFSDSHKKTYQVRDSSTIKTLQNRLLERMRSSKNMLIIISKDTSWDRGMLNFEIEKAVDYYEIPLIVAYVGYEYILAPAKLSRLSFHFLFSKNGRISSVMRPDPDLTQTGAKTRWIYRDLFDKTSRVSLFSRIF